MEFKEFTVTPEMAKAWLENNPTNRAISQRRVKSYAAAMAAGEWTGSNDAICFFEDGTLANGQHRLLAIIKYGKPVKMLIGHDVPKNTVMDRGKSRSVGDSLYMQGAISKQMSSSFVIAAVRMYLKILLKREARDHEISEFITENENIIQQVIEASYIGSKEGKTTRSAPAQAALLGAALNSGYPISVIERFCKVANSGFSSSPAESAAIVLRLTRERMPLRLSGAEREKYCYTVQKAFYSFAKGEHREQKFRNPVNIWIK